MNQFEEVIRKRRSIYDLGNKPVLTEQEVTKIVEECLWNAPSAFNSQSPRVILLFGKSYQDFWHMVLETLRQIVPPAKFKPTEEKIASFAKGLGTILYFEDDAVVQDLQNKFPTYADKFPKWSEQANAILQYMIWTALAEKNVGATIQHYNPLIDEQVRTAYAVPPTWRLIAQMPFGSIDAAAGEKTHVPLDQRLKIYR